MKQSEQFFRLSNAAGYETKPILLYYGLNQATRAIVGTLAEPDAKWAISGHGITCPNLDTETTLGDVQVVDRGKNASFQMLGKYTNSPTLPQSLPLREVWASLPEGADVPLQGSLSLWSAVKFGSANGERSMFETLWRDRNGVVARLGGLPYDLGGAQTVEEVQALLWQKYPAIGFLKPALAPDGRLDGGWQLNSNRLGLGLTVADDVPEKEELELRGMDILRAGHLIYWNSRTVYTRIIPVLPGNTTPLSPLVTWWAILFTLSMLARYQPSSWTRMLDIDSSPDAPAVEYLLDEAHRACLNLIADVFEGLQFKKDLRVPAEIQRQLEQWRRIRGPATGARATD
jgi:hypothetical protein